MEKQPPAGVEKPVSPSPQAVQSSVPAFFAISHKTPQCSHRLCHSKQSEEPAVRPAHRDSPRRVSPPTCNARYSLCNFVRCLGMAIWSDTGKPFLHCYCRYRITRVEENAALVEEDILLLNMRVKDLSRSSSDRRGSLPRPLSAQTRKNSIDCSRSRCGCYEAGEVPANRLTD